MQCAHHLGLALGPGLSAHRIRPRSHSARLCRIGTTHSTDDRWTRFPLHECLRFIEIALCTPPRPHAPSDTACPSMGPCGVGRARCTLCLPRLLSGSALLTRRALSGSVWPCGVGGSVLALLRFRLLFHWSPGLVRLSWSRSRQVSGGRQGRLRSEFRRPSRLEGGLAVTPGASFILIRRS